MDKKLQKLLERASVSLLLESYDAIFSDFDPRPYSERAISDDFIHEAKKAVHETKQNVMELRFLIPRQMKNTHKESLIRSRLHKYFEVNELMLMKETRNIIRNGIILACSGLMLMFGSALMMHFSEPSLIVNFVRVLLEPSGWFLAWFGMDKIFYYANQQKNDLEFFRNVMHAKIHFGVY